MSDNKKYYYLKLKENFFDSSEIRVLEAMPNGYKYSNLLLKLYLKSLKFNGKLILNEYIPYNAEMIAAVVSMDIDTVKVAFDLFKQLKLIEVLDDGTIYMLEIQNFIGASSSEADRKRLYRLEIEAKKKRISDDKYGQGHLSGQMSDISPPEIEIEKEKELDIEKEITSSSSEENFEEEEEIVPTNELKEVLRLCQSFNYKLKKIDAKCLIDAFGGLVVKKAIGIAANTEAFRNNQIKNYSSYLASILKDLSTEETKTINIQRENKKLRFADYTQKEYDYEKLEEELLGWD